MRFTISTISQTTYFATTCFVKQGLNMSACLGLGETCHIKVSWLRNVLIVEHIILYQLEYPFPSNVLKQV